MQRSATDIDTSLGNLVDYLVSKLFKFAHNFDKINMLFGKKIKKLRDNNISNAKSISLIMLAGIIYSLHSLSQAYLDTQV